MTISRHEIAVDLEHKCRRDFGRDAPRMYALKRDRKRKYCCFKSVPKSLLSLYTYTLYKMPLRCCEEGIIQERERESTNHNIFLGEFSRHGINTRKIGPLFIIIIIIITLDQRRFLKT